MGGELELEALSAAQGRYGQKQGDGASDGSE